MNNKIKSVLDIGCGDWQLSRLIDWSGIKYTGIDVSDVVLANIKKYASENVLFCELDAVTDELPFAELVIMKDVIQHWSNDEIVQFLPKLKNFKFALITNGFPHQAMSRVNTNIQAGGWRPIDLTAAPFNLGGAYVFSYVGDEIKRIFLYSNY